MQGPIQKTRVIWNQLKDYSVWMNFPFAKLDSCICMLTLHLYIIYCYFKAHHGMNASVKALLSFVCTLITGKLTWLNVIWNMLNCLTDFRFQGLSGHVAISLNVVYIPNYSAFIETKLQIVFAVHISKKYIVRLQHDKHINKGFIHIS